MAAYSKDVDVVVNEISTILKSFEEHVVEMTTTFAKRREIIERHNENCSSLLLRPWPKCVVDSLFPTDQCSDEIPVSSTVEMLTSVGNDKEELQLLDNILAKAQHAREIQRKMVTTGNSKSYAIRKSKTSITSSLVKDKTRSKTNKKVAYPILKQESFAKSTYSISYTKPVNKTKTLQTGTKKTIPLKKDDVMAPEQHKRMQLIQDGKVKPEDLPELPTQKLKISRDTKCSSSVVNTQHPVASGDLNAEKRSDIKFLLSERGSSLLLPEEYEKVRKQHKILHRQIQKAKRPARTQSEEKFVQKMEESFHPQLQSTSSVCELQTDVSKLEKELIDLRNQIKMELLNERSQKETDESQIVDDLSSKSWQTIKMRFQTLKKELKSVKENLYRLNEFCPMFDHPLNENCVEENCDNRLPLFPLSSGSWKTGPDGYFTYNNVKEVKTLLKLSYDLPNIEYQLKFRKTLGDTILPLLGDLPTNHELFVPLIRFLYSILCCDGKTFPTFVKDSFS